MVGHKLKNQELEHSDLLNTLAQTALGTHGFTGVVVALNHSSDD